MKSTVNHDLERLRCARALLQVRLGDCLRGKRERVRCVVAYLSVVYEVELFVVIGHEEVEHQVDGEEEVEEDADNDPVDVVCLGEGDPCGRYDADRKQNENVGKIPKRLSAR